MEAGMENITVNMELDAELLAKSEALFNELGMDVGTAIVVFLKQAVRDQRIPFTVAINMTEQQQAAKTVDDISKTMGLDKMFDTMNDMLGDLKDDEYK